MGSILGLFNKVEVARGKGMLGVGKFKSGGEVRDFLFMVGSGEVEIYDEKRREIVIR